MGKDCKGRIWVEREGWDGKDGGCEGRNGSRREGWKVCDWKGGMGVEGRDGKYVIGREGWDEIGREGWDEIGKEGLDDKGNLFSHCSYLAWRKKILKLLAQLFGSFFLVAPTLP